jgi:hypothetical protein
VSLEGQWMGLLLTREVMNVVLLHMASVRSVELIAPSGGW